MGRKLPSRANSPTTAYYSGTESFANWSVAVKDDQGNRQIEAAGVLGQIGRSQVDHRSAGTPAVAAVHQGPLDAVDALAHGCLRQADQHGLGQTGGDIPFRLDGSGFDSYQGKSVELGRHGSTASGIRG